MQDTKHEQSNNQIAAQNDQFRTSLGIIPGDPNAPIGTLVITGGASDAVADRVFDLMSLLRAFTDFNNECDPYGLHEMGILELDGRTFWFKIDLYDLKYEMGSDAPEDSSQTRRVLTLLLPEEY